MRLSKALKKLLKEVYSKKYSKILIYIINISDNKAILNK